ncbi:MAG: hypothetical protein HYY30_13410 [Chloroflexi bacterium]|nr:hypothetical protein [Chloroflexota bacterium]
MRRRLTEVLVLFVVGILALGVVIGCAQTPVGPGPEEFYRGKTIIWIVSSAAGADTDLLSRAVAIFLAKEIGVAVKVDNRDSDEGVNYAYAEAKPDGLTLVIKSTAALMSNDILKAPGTLYETDKFNFVADLNPHSQMMSLSPKLPYQTLDALRQAKGLKGGASSARGSLATGAALMFEILGLDGKVITGYKSSKDTAMAVGRGEADFIVTSDGSSQKDEADGYTKMFMVLSDERSSVAPSVPTMLELGVKVPKELESARQYIASSGFALALSPEVPQARVEYIRKTFQKLGDNKDLQKEVEKVMGSWTPFMPGKELQQRVAIIKANKDLAGQLDTIFSKYKAVQ